MMSFELFRLLKFNRNMYFIYIFSSPEPKAPGELIV